MYRTPVYDSPSLLIHRKKELKNDKKGILFHVKSSFRSRSQDFLYLLLPLCVFSPFPFFCVSLLRKTKKRFYANLNHRDLADNKQLWRTVKPLLSDKSKSNEKIILVEDNEIINEDKENAQI